MISRTALATVALLSLGACQGLVPAPTVPSPAPVPSTPIPSVSSIPTAPSASEVPTSSAPSDVSSAPESSMPASSAPESSVPEEKTYTMAEVAKHATPEDCWFVIAGTVYDVTGFGAKHGGGESVYEGCGKDATALFETRPMGSGTPHSEKARGFLPNFAIGKLAS